MKSTIRQLKEELKQLSNSLLKAQKANELSRAYLYRDLDLVEKYASLALSLLNKENHEEILLAHMNLGSCKLLRQDFNAGLDYYYKVFSETKSDQLLLRCYMAIGVCYSKLDMNKEALSFQEKALELAQITKDHSASAAIFNNYATIFTSQGHFDLSESYFLKALDIATTNDFSNIQAYVYVGLLHNDLRRKRYDQMDDYFYKIEQLIDSENEMWFLGITQCLKACFCVAHDNLEKAEVYFEMGIDILETEEQFMYLVLAYNEFILSLQSADYYKEANELLSVFEEIINKNNLQMGKGIFLKTAMDYHASTKDIKSYHKYHKKYNTYKNYYSKILSVYQ